MHNESMQRSARDLGHSLEGCRHASAFRPDSVDGLEVAGGIGLGAGQDAHDDDVRIWQCQPPALLASAWREQLTMQRHEADWRPPLGHVHSRCSVVPNLELVIPLQNEGWPLPTKPGYHEIRSPYSVCVYVPRHLAAVRRRLLDFVFLRMLRICLRCTDRTNHA